MKKILLYSGGLDSWLIRQLWQPDICIYVDIGSKYSEEEKKRLPSDVIVVPFSFLGEQELPNGFVPLRNLYFIMIASHFGDEICLGATAGDWGNKDKTPEFLAEAEHLINELWSDKKVNQAKKINKDFIYQSKTSLLEQYLNKGGSIIDVKNNTFSCYSPEEGHECFDCYPCFRKFAILKAFGYEYSEEEELRMWSYIKNYIIPTKEQGGYAGTYYTDRGEESKHLIATVEYMKGKYL